MTTHVYIDFDGVYNALCSGEYPSFNSGWSPESYKSYKVDGYRLKVSEELVEALNALAAREDVEFHWLTTWQHRAANRLSPVIGIDGAEWAVHSHEDVGVSMEDWSTWWKYVIMRGEFDNLVEGDRIVWIDDDLPHDAKAAYWVKSMPEDRILAIAPYSAVGVTSDDMSAILDFIEGHFDGAENDDSLALEA